MGAPPTNISPSRTQLPDVSFLTKDVPPPSPLYVTEDDSIRVLHYSSINTPTMRLVGRILRTSDGKIIPFSENIVPDGSRIQVINRFPLIEGFLLSVALVTLSGGVQNGQIFGQLSIIHGGQLTQGPAFILAYGHITLNSGIGWPGNRNMHSMEGPGNIRYISGTDPAAGVEIAETVPAGARWRLLRISANLATDATVGVRRVQWLLDASAVINYQASSTNTQTASLTVRHTFAPSGSELIVSGISDLVPSPLDTLLYANHRIRTLTQNIVAGDNWGQPALIVEEWMVA